MADDPFRRARHHSGSAARTPKIIRASATTSGPAEDAELLALSDEFEAAWKAEREIFRIDEGQSDGVNFKKYDDRCTAAVDAVSKIVDKILNIPARSLAGFRLKARALLWCNGSAEVEDFCSWMQGTTDQRLIAAIVRELLTHAAA